MKRNEFVRSINIAVLVLALGLGYPLKADTPSLSAEEAATLHVQLKSSKPESYQAALERLTSVNHIPDGLIGDVLAIYIGSSPSDDDHPQPPKTLEDRQALLERMRVLARGIQLDGEIESLCKKMDAKALAEALVPYLQDEKTRWHMIVIPAHNPDVAKLLIPEMTIALSDTNENIVSLAGEALAQAGPGAKAATPQLLSALSNKGDKAEFSARRALEAIGPLDKEYVPVLLTMIKDSNTIVAGDCEDMLSKIDFDPSTQLPGLMDGLNRGYSGTIIDLLIKAGPKVIPLLIEHAAKSTAGTDSLDAHVTILEHWGQQSAKALAPDLRSTNDNLRYVAVSVACDHPDPAQKNPDWLLPYLNADPDKDIRAMALYQWVQKSSDTPARLAVIEKHINDPDLQETAINAAGTLKMAAKPALPFIQAVIEKADDKSKIEYLVDDLAIDPSDDHAYANLIGYVRNSNVDLAKQAVDALMWNDGLRVRSKSDLQKVHDDPNTPSDVKFEIEIKAGEH